ncbi:MAG: hypothetical protein ABH832_02800 [bacterium]
MNIFLISTKRAKIKKKNRILISMFTLLAVAGMIFTPLTASSFGLAPSTITVNNLSNKSNAKKTINLVRAEIRKNEDRFFRVYVTGSGAKYIVLPSEKVKMGIGETIVPYYFYIKPASAANGDYEANLYIVSDDSQSPEKATGSSVTIIGGIMARIFFTVTDKQISEFIIDEVSFKPAEVGLPIVLSYHIKNTGNIDIVFDKITLNLIDSTDSTNVFDITVPSSQIEPSSPSEEKTFQINIDNTVDQGSYTATIDFWQKGKIIKSATLPLAIYAEGTSSQSAEITDFHVGGTDFLPNDLVTFEGKVKNTGSVAIKPILFVELKKDDKTTELLRSDPKIVGINKFGDFLLSYRPQEKGNYLARAHFEYGFSETSKITSNFIVAVPINYAYYYAGAGIGAVLLFLIIIMIVKKKKKKKNENQDEQAKINK